MKKLWSASKKQILNSNLYKYERFLNLKYKIKFGLNYNRILNWSIKNPGNFWDSIWDFCKVKGNKGNIKIIDMSREESIDIDDKFDFNLAKFIIKTR